MTGLVKWPTVVVRLASGLLVSILLLVELVLLAIQRVQVSILFDHQIAHLLLNVVRYEAQGDLVRGQFAEVILDLPVFEHAVDRAVFDKNLQKNVRGCEREKEQTEINCNYSLRR